MSDKPEALRLANLIDHGNDSSWIEREAAAELRRLHALNGELLEALDKIAINTHDDTAERVARAAIARAEGQK
jgi:hypothetical protein